MMLALFTQDDIAMDDDVLLDARRREDLRLIKAFLSIVDPGKRQRVLELAEQLAEEAAPDAAGLASAATDTSFVDPSRDAPGPTE